MVYTNTRRKYNCKYVTALTVIYVYSFIAKTRTSTSLSYGDKNLSQQHEQIINMSYILVSTSMTESCYIHIIYHLLLS